MKRSSWLVSGVLVSIAVLIASPGCSGGSRTTEPTTLPSASRPARPPTRVRTEQSRKDPLEVDEGSERMGTLGGPLERRRLPSDQESIGVPEVEIPKDGERPRTSAEDEEEVPDDLQRGGPDPDATGGVGTTGSAGTNTGTTGATGTSGTGDSTGGLIPIDVPPSAGKR